MMCVSGSGEEDIEGVFEEERDVEGSDATRRESLSPEHFAKPWPEQMKHDYRRTLAQLLV
jgi:hypothetical protein